MVIWICYFPHPHYTVYRCAGHARRAVNCVIAAVMWSDLWTNHCCSTFVHILQFRILPTAAFKQPLKEVVGAIAANIFVQFPSLLYHGMRLHNSLSTCVLNL